MNGGRPQKYLELAERIKDMIVSCRLRRGDLLPPERKFAEMLGCSHLTLRKALQLLEKDNLIHVIPSRGRFVGPRPHDETKQASIGFLIPNSDPFYFRIFTLLENYLYTRNLHPVVHVSDGSRTKEAALLQTAEEQHLAALVAVPNPQCADQYAALGIPVTFFDYPLPGLQRPCVVCDDYEGARAAVDYLVGTGARRIAHIGGLYNPACEDRLHGYLDSLAKHDLPRHEAWIVRDTPTREAGLYAARALFESKGPQPEAILCCNDAVAAGVVHYFARRGEAPCRLIGFGNTSVAEDLGISSVDQHTDKIAGLILRNLQLLLNGEKPPLKTVVPTELIIR